MAHVFANVYIYTKYRMQYLAYMYCAIHKCVHIDSLCNCVEIRYVCEHT